MRKGAPSAYQGRGAWGPAAPTLPRTANPNPGRQLNESLGLLPLEDSPQHTPRDSHAFVATDPGLGLGLGLGLANPNRSPNPSPAGSPEAPRASLASVPQPQVGAGLEHPTPVLGWIVSGSSAYAQAPSSPNPPTL